MKSLAVITTATAVGLVLSCGSPDVSAAKEIIYDSEFQLLQKQHGKKWAAEDVEIEKKLEALKKKHGKRPNIIHIMWDDMKYGAIGHPMLNNVTGYKSPNINKMAAEGMTLTRMYSEPSCTPTRVAAMTGRYSVRSGMIFPIFPIHQMGLPADMVDEIAFSSLVYDIGMVKVSPKVKLKPSNLTEGELAQIKSHCFYGAEIVEKIKER